MDYRLVPAFAIAFISLFSPCKKTDLSTEIPCEIQSDNVAIGSKLLTRPDSDKIMGEASQLTCNTFLKKGDTLEYKCEYTPLAQDAVSGKTGKLGLMDEVYKDAAAAHNAYVAIYESNRSHPGVEIVPHMGDEAYYHSDGKNFYFFLVRKGERMYRMKLNKVTSHSSEAEFKRVGKLIVDRM